MNCKAIFALVYGEHNNTNIAAEMVYLRGWERPAAARVSVFYLELSTTLVQERHLARNLQPLSAPLNFDGSYCVQRNSLSKNVPGIRTHLRDV